jgi:hypothetical protein
MTAQRRPEHDEVESFLKAEAGQEPTPGDFDISLSLPATIEVKMVDASILLDYEVWSFGASALLSFLVGFVVAWAQEKEAHTSNIMGIVCLIFAVLFAACLIMALFKRHTMRKRSKTIRLKTSRVGEIRPDKKTGQP